MFKNVRWIFVVLVLAFISLSFKDKDSRATGLHVGDKAPAVRLDEKTVLDLSDMIKGKENKYVILSFWAGFDAESRLRNANLGYLATSSKKIKLVSISLDKYQAIYEAEIRRDKLSSPECLTRRIDKTSDLYRDYKLKKGLRSYLVDCNGTILAKDVTASKLQEILN